MQSLPPGRRTFLDIQSFDASIARNNKAKRTKNVPLSISSKPNECQTCGSPRAFNWSKYGNHTGYVGKLSSFNFKVHFPRWTRLVLDTAGRPAENLLTLDFRRSVLPSPSSTCISTMVCFALFCVVLFKYQLPTRKLEKKNLTNNPRPRDSSHHSRILPPPPVAWSFGLRHKRGVFAALLVFIHKQFRIEKH